ncbi:uncharacterized protein [Miscanthus floridulus]|uniref:uncharacterized protein n=1 Tax=Miscanthus floridulus TaxID=154761 RepID=UPI003458EED6
MPRSSRTDAEAACVGLCDRKPPRLRICEQGRLDGCKRAQVGNSTAGQPRQPAFYLALHALDHGIGLNNAALEPYDVSALKLSWDITTKRYVHKMIIYMEGLHILPNIYNPGTYLIC